MSDEKHTIINIEGMTCSNCALGVKKQLEKKGLDEVTVNFSTGEASYINTTNVSYEEISSSINNMGYEVVGIEGGDEQKGLSSIEKKFYFTLLFTFPLFLHMFFPKHYLINNIWVQISLCSPVFILGVIHFGKSALGSLKSGVPNMDVLIFMGITSAFGYSLYGTIAFYGSHLMHNYMFFETAATITTLVLLGNVLEHRSVHQTTTAIKELSKLQKVKAKRVLSNGEIEEVEYDEIQAGDTLQFNSGDKIVNDGEVIYGKAVINESMLSGESEPINKEIHSKVVGGTIVEDGLIKVKVVKVGSDTVLSQIIKLVKQAQQNQPDIQRLGDKVSAVFVPIVIGISIITFLVALYVFQISLQQSLMQSIAVLVISCPCAMGLATPTAVMVGIGRAAKNGILIKGGNTLEQFANVKNIVFDKTGTLTTGDFTIKHIELYNNSIHEEVKNILLSIEQNSSHPIATSIVSKLKDNAKTIEISDVEEIKGFGVKAKDNQGNNYVLGSHRVAENFSEKGVHSIYLIKNEQLIAGIDIEDELKNHVPETIALLNQQGINTVLLSGDKKEKCEKIAKEVKIQTVYSEQLPEHKLVKIEELQEQNFTAMVGDGINDAPALAKADVGISLSKATQIAVQSAKIVLLSDKDLKQVYESYLISKHTLKTIKQNLFWAFFYNVIAIPIAAFGFLNPMVAALAMAFSDVIVIGNSIRLRYKNLH